MNIVELKDLKEEIAQNTCNIERASFDEYYIGEKVWDKPLKEHARLKEILKQLTTKEEKILYGIKIFEEKYNLPYIKNILKDFMEGNSEDFLFYYKNRLFGMLRNK